MNPLAQTPKVLVSTVPCDMRAGIQRLIALVSSSLRCDPRDGNLYVFVSKDAKKAKILRAHPKGWMMYYVVLTDGVFRWSSDRDHPACLEVRKRDFERFLLGFNPQKSKG